MSSEQLLFSQDHAIHQDEWLAIDDLFEFPSDYFESNSSSVNSISPRDCELALNDVDLFNWGSDPVTSSQTLLSELGGYETLETCNPSTRDFCLNPNDILQHPSTLPQESYVGSAFDSAWLQDTYNLEDPLYSSIRQTVESRAALDPRQFSTKEKRREASIALHLQRLQDTSTPSLYLSSSGSGNNLSSPCWPESPPGMVPPSRSSASPATTSISDKYSPSTSGLDPGAGPMQMVLDLNMNATTNVPRKQKPRSQAQKENYIKARKYGVCEKHRKQHKRCNCLEKTAAAHLSMTQPSCAAPKTGVGLTDIHPNLHVNLRSSCSAVADASATRSEQRRPQFKRLIKNPILDLSATPTVWQPPTQGQHLSTSQISPTRLSTHRARDMCGNYQNTRSVQTVLAESRHQHQASGSQDLSVHGDVVTVRRRVVTVQSFSKTADVAFKKTAQLSYWKFSTGFPSWAGSVLGRFISGCSRFFLQCRKEYGLLSTLRPI